MATDPTYARLWVMANIIRYPSTKIILITLGNEVLHSCNPQLIAQLLPTMQNLQSAINESSLGGKVRVSTVHSMAVLGPIEPPSEARFDETLADTLNGLLDFNRANGSPFMLKAYPFLSYQSESTPSNLAFCLFDENPGRVDLGTNVSYHNMFDTQVDATRVALNAMSFSDVDIMVAETGWPYKGDFGASVENARKYNSRLVAHLKLMVETPLMLMKSIDTNLYALYDEGSTSGNSFGFFHVNSTPIYDIGFSSTTTSYTSAHGSSSATSNVYLIVAILAVVISVITLLTKLIGLCHCEMKLGLQR